MRLDPKPRAPRAQPLPRLTAEFLVSLGDRSIRDRLGLFPAEGLRSFHSAVANATPILGLARSPSLLSYPARCEMDEFAKDRGIPLLEVSRADFQSFSAAREPKGVLLVCPQRWDPLPSHVGQRDLWIGVENLRTPGNLGTLMRSAAAFGASGLMVFGPPRDRTDVYAPQSVRASMGGVFSLRIVQTSHRAFRSWNRRYELTVLGACPKAPTEVRRVSLRRPVLLMLGSEREGLSEAQRDSCDGFVRIPMSAGTDSINVAMAGTVLMYEAVSQRGCRGRR
ncbi:MAG: RNA methyltransferase [Fimbriimonadaceae bacterium]|nr:RNA methyltransferase [Fimbriimonadaceae bacterium]